jgi:hypothetical protein
LNGTPRFAGSGISWNPANTRSSDVVVEERRLMTAYGAATADQPGEGQPATVAEIAEAGEAVLKEVGTAVVGMEQSLRLALAAILAGGHVLFEDVPGLGKTLAARSLAGALGLEFRRLQCTPDLLPGDVTGSFVWDPGPREFSFRPGPLFTARSAQFRDILLSQMFSPR